MYPGTSGAPSFLSHIIADSTVIPVESQGQFYSEKLLLLPETYQVSFDGPASPSIVHSFVTDGGSRGLYDAILDERTVLRR